MTVALEAAPTNGATPTAQPLPPEGPPTQWLVIGPRTRAAMAVQVERALGLVLLALLETSGVPEGAGYRLVIDSAHLEPAPAEAPPAGAFGTP